MRMFYSYIQYLIIEVHKKFIQESSFGRDKKHCTRCKSKKFNPDESQVCFNCHRSVFCSMECMKKNQPIHEVICKILFLKNKEVTKVVELINQSMSSYSHKKKHRDKIQRYDENILDN